MKKIVIINQDAGYLMIDLANAFFDDNYEVSLITGRLVQRSTPLNQGVKLVKINRYRRNNIFSKVISWLVGVFQIMLLIWFKFRGHYLLIVSNPPLAPLLPLVCKNSYSLLIYDVYVETPEQFAIVNKLPFLIKLWKNAHSKAFKNAGNIYTLTAGMASAIEKYAGKKKCEVVPLWTDNELLQPVSALKNPFIAEHHLWDKFIVLYSGSIGESSGVEYLVEVATCIDYEQIVFLIIGEGSKKSALLRRIELLGLKNCIILPWQEVSVLPFSLASANLAVVTLAGNSSYNAIPSKLFNYLSVGSPILCLAEPESDLGQLVRKEGIGKCFKPSMKEEIAEFILQLFNDPIQTKDLSYNSLRASKKYTSKIVHRFLKDI